MPLQSFYSPDFFSVSYLKSLKLELHTYLFMAEGRMEIRCVMPCNTIQLAINDGVVEYVWLCTGGYTNLQMHIQKKNSFDVNILQLSTDLFLSWV